MNKRHITMGSEVTLLMVTHFLIHLVFVVCPNFRALNQWVEGGILPEEICVYFCQALGHFQPRCTEMSFPSWVFQTMQRA